MRLLITIVIMFFLLPLSQIFAQAPEDEIKLPDIIILGETEKLLDTISLEERLRPFWNLHSLKRFEYEPFLTPESMIPYQEKIKRYDGLISLHGGNTYYLNFLGLYDNPRNNWLSFYAGFQNRQNDKNRIRRSFFAGWSPSYKSIAFDLETSYYLFEQQTDLQTESINRTEELGFSLTLETDRAVINPIDIRNVYLNISYKDYKQVLPYYNGENDLPGITTKITDIDLHTRMTFPLEEAELSIPIEIILVKQTSPGLNAGVRIEDFFLLDNISLHLIADRYALFPSIGFQFKYDLNSYSRIFLANEPQIDTRNRSDFLLDNPDQELKVNKRIVKNPLNASLTFENDRWLPLSLAYKIRWHKDYLYYSESTEQYLFAQNNTDLMEQQLSLVLAYHIKDILLRNSFEYFSYNEDIPFIPQWQNKTTIGWYAVDWQIWSDLIYIGKRKNLIDVAMKDALLLSFTARKKIIDNLTAEVSVNNLLDQSYRKYELTDPQYFDNPVVTNQIPTEPLFFKGGLIWRF
ncbi:MAG: TonB-dependent receptor [Candidatus Cloacimonetes bacterium]|nr:TonB-dependent receptor [Candidatus Cloacimonadota bacterium]